MSPATPVPIGLIHSLLALTDSSFSRLRVLPDNDRMERRQAARGPDERLSQHPTDRLVRDLIRLRRTPTLDDRQRVIERLQTTPFNPRIAPIRPEDRGLRAAGVELNEPTDELSYHLVVRIAGDRQWTATTDRDSYLADLRRAAGIEHADIALSYLRGGNIVLAAAPTHEAVPESRRGPGSLPLTVVVYSADRGLLLTGYQASSLDKIRIAEDALWLPKLST